MFVQVCPHAQNGQPSCVILRWSDIFIFLMIYFTHKKNVTSYLLDTFEWYRGDVTGNFFFMLVQVCPHAQYGQPSCVILRWSDVYIFLIIYFTHKKTRNKLAFGQIWLIQMGSQSKKIFHVCLSVSTCPKWLGKLCHFNTKQCLHSFDNFSYTEENTEQVSYSTYFNDIDGIFKRKIISCLFKCVHMPKMATKVGLFW